MKQTHITENAIQQSLQDFTLSKQLKLRVGKLLLPLFPSIAEKVEAAPFSSDGRLFKLVRNGLYAHAFEDRDFSRLRGFLSQYWTQEAANFHEACQDRFDRMFLNHDVEVIDSLEALIKGHDDGVEFDHLYEIGCGGGQVLNYLAERLTNLDEFIGIDLAAEQIGANRKNHQHPKISFRTADAVEWIPQNAKPRSVILTNGGVFEYFLKEELQALFDHVAANLAPAAIALIETIGSNHDLEKQGETFVYGSELSFSHNYPQLLRDAGFEIEHQSERAGYAIDGGGRWLRLLATKT